MHRKQASQLFKAQTACHSGYKGWLGGMDLFEGTGGCMRFVFERDKLLNMVSIAKGIVSTNNFMAILSNVLLNVADDTLTLICTDTKVSMRSTMSVDVQDEGKIVVNLDKLAGILSSLSSGLIEFTCDENKVAIKPIDSKRVKFNLKCLSVDNFPELKWDVQHEFSVVSVSLRRMLKVVLDSVSDDPSRYFMCGVYFEACDGKLRLVSTNGRRLALAEDNVGFLPDSLGYIVPPKALVLFSKSLSGNDDVKLSFNDNSMYIISDNITLSTTLIDGNFPNYRRVIPENQDKVLEVDKNEFISALSRAKQIVDAKINKVSLTVSNAKLTVSASSDNIGSSTEEIAVFYQGEEVVFNVNVDYMHNALECVTGDTVKMSFPQPLKPITIESMTPDGSFHVVMPMQV